MSWQSWDFAASGTTIIDGAGILADTITALSLKAGAVTSDKLTVGLFQRSNLLANGQFGTYNSYGNSISGWTLGAGVTFNSQAGTYTPNIAPATPGSLMCWQGRVRINFFLKSR